MNICIEVTLMEWFNIFDLNEAFIEFTTEQTFKTIYIKHLLTE